MKSGLYMAPGGYVGRYLLVNLSRSKIEEFDFDENSKISYLGGYGLGCKFIYENQKKGTDPLRPENTPAFMAGPVNGISIPGGARYAVCSKSPLTCSRGDSNCGGSFGPRMKIAGFDGIFFTGAAERPVYLLLENGKTN